jgi:hypothetical protein
MEKNRIYKWGGLLLVTAVTLFLLGTYLRTELRITGGELGAPLDDAWIHFQFARNISQGAGFSYNPGEPTPGSTAPLWTIILAAVGLFDVELMVPALALSTFFLLLSLWLAYGFTCWITRSVWAALLAGLGVALTGRMLWAGLAGMETTAFAALSLAAIWAYSRWGISWFPALLFGLAGQLRPEGHALFALALADAAWMWWLANRSATDGRLRSLARHFLPALIIYALIAAPYSLFSLATTGRPLPNTFYAKVGSQHLFSGRTLQETMAWHWQDNPFSLILILFGLVPLWRRSRLSVLWLLGLPLLTAVIIDFTWHHGRYTMPLIPLQMVAAAVGAHWIVGRFAGVKDEVWRSHLRKAAPVLLILFLLLGGGWRLTYWATMLGKNTREVQDIDVALGHWLAENTPPESVIAVDDIGAIAFLSGRRIVDMNGLVSPEVWPATRAVEGLPRSQMMTRILSEAQPDYMAAFPLWRWDIATNTAVAKPVHHVQTDTHTIIFQQDANVYETVWPYISEADPDTKIMATFGEGIGLLGYDIEIGNPLQLIFYWKSQAAVADNYDVFVHLLDEGGEIVAQSDRKPVDGLVATDIWQPGDIIRDPVLISLPPDLQAGSYGLQMGVYLRESGERLEVQGGDSTGNTLLLEPIFIP